MNTEPLPAAEMGRSGDTRGRGGRGGKTVDGAATASSQSRLYKSRRIYWGFSTARTGEAAIQENEEGVEMDGDGQRGPEVAAVITTDGEGA